jgi:hypothetical protein
MALRALVKPVSGSYKGGAEKSSVAKLYRYPICNNVELITDVLTSLCYCAYNIFPFP